MNEVVERTVPDAAWPVLSVAPLKAGFDRSKLSRFGDASWDLSPAVFRNNARRCHVTVHFTTILDAGQAGILREFLYARLNVDIPGCRVRIPPTGVRQHFNRAKRFLDFVQSQRGAYDLGLVDQPFLDGYRAHLQSGVSRQPEQTALLLETVVDLHYYRHHISSGGLSVLPWQGRSAFYVAGARQTGENKTPRIPENIIGPLVRWSLKYVVEFGPDILAGRAELNALETQYRKFRDQDERTSRIARLAAFLEQRRSNSRGVPLWSSTPAARCRGGTRTVDSPAINYHLIRLYTGAPTTSRLSQDRVTAAMISSAVEEIGTEIGGLDTAISCDSETGLAWRPRFDAITLALEERMLQTACYILCAYLTGMRDCEVQAMDSGCLVISRSEDGIIERFRIKSAAYKGRRATGETEDWITIEPVAQALTILGRLTERIRAQRGGDSLWRVLHQRPNGKEHISAEIVRSLNNFRDHLNQQFGAIDSPILPLGPGGIPWRFTTRQFRRTVAWYIANRPFGLVAGKIQYKHASIAAFEGYAGESASGFRQEIERERALGQLDDIVEYYEQRAIGERLSGSAAGRVEHQLSEVAQKLDPLPGIIADPPRVRKMLSHLARTLFVVFSTIAFSIQLQPFALPPLVPRIPPNQPFRSVSRTVSEPCVTARHRPQWESSIRQAEEMLKSKGLSVFQREALESEVTRLKKMLAPREGVPDQRQAYERRVNNAPKDL